MAELNFSQGLMLEFVENALSCLISSLCDDGRGCQGRKVEPQHMRLNFER